LDLPLICLGYLHLIVLQKVLSNWCFTTINSSVDVKFLSLLSGMMTYFHIKCIGCHLDFTTNTHSLAMMSLHSVASVELTFADGHPIQHMCCFPPGTRVLISHAITNTKVPVVSCLSRTHFHGKNITYIKAEWCLKAKRKI
jgi:hypothetical protein